MPPATQSTNRCDCTHARFARIRLVMTVVRLARSRVEPQVTRCLCCPPGCQAGVALLSLSLSLSLSRSLARISVGRALPSFLRLCEGGIYQNRLATVPHTSGIRLPAQRAAPVATAQRSAPRARWKSPAFGGTGHENCLTTFALRSLRLLSCACGDR